MPRTGPPAVDEGGAVPARGVTALTGSALRPPDPDDARRHGPDRVLALSDGVFAIIITILVLEIAVPSDLSHENLHEALAELRPTLLAWVVSFLITGMYWVGHRDLFSRIRVVNRDLVWLNLLFLLPACLIPFAASVIGEYPDEPIALYFYGLVMIVVSLMRLLNYWYVMRRPRLLVEQATADRPWVVLATAGATIPVYLVAMVAAVVSPLASMLIFLAVPLLYFLLITALRERAETQAEGEDFT